MRRGWLPDTRWVAGGTPGRAPGDGRRAAEAVAAVFYARAVRPAAKRGLFILFCFVCSTLIYAWRTYTYTYLRVYLYITVCVAGGVAKLRARRAAGRQPELATEWVPVKQVAVSRLRGDYLDSVEAMETVDSVDRSVDSVRCSTRASFIPGRTCDYSYNHA